MSDFTGSSIFGIDLINVMNTISGDDDSIKPEQTSNDYCERCGRLGQCSQIYVCEFTTDINGLDLPYDELEYDSSEESEEGSSEESEESEEDDSSEEEEGPQTLDELLDIVYLTCTKCWRYGHFAEECESTTHVLGHKLDVYL